MALNKLPRSGIADSAVTTAKVSDGVINAATEFTDSTIASDRLADCAVTNAKLSNSAITIRGTSVSLGGSLSVNPNVNWQSKVTSDGSTVTTMVAGQGYFVDNSSAAGIVKLPASAAIGDTVAIKDYAANFGTNNLTIQRNSHNIQGSATDGLISTNRASVVLVYVDSTKGWLYADEHNVGDLQEATFTEATGGTVTTSGDYKIHTFTGDGNFVVSQLGNNPSNPSGGPNTVSYAVVAGGGSGGGGYGGGGGAGGYREGRDITPSYTASPLVAGSGLTISATTFPVTVGGGGSDSNGSNSIFSTITSAGGGRGRYGNGAPEVGSGGSGGGGGGGGPGVAGSGNTPPVSPSQGNNGGTGSGGLSPGGTCSPRYGRSGGGGASAVGGSSSNTAGGNGGAGTPTQITGSAVTRAGGGGGGYYTVNGTGSHAGSAGSGGGGAGSPGTAAPNSGTANTGGGGGGSSTPNPGGHPTTGGTGGSGIVIIRYKYQ